MPAIGASQKMGSRDESFDYGGGFVVGVVGVVGEVGIAGAVACGNGVSIKGVGAAILLANPTLGQRSKLAVSVK